MTNVVDSDMISAIIKAYQLEQDKKTATKSKAKTASPKKSKLGPQNTSTPTTTKSHFQKKRKSRLEEEQQTHALVFWTKESSNKKYSIVKRSDIDIQEGEELIENNVYQVNFNKQKYPARIITIGTRQNCETIFQHKMDFIEEIEIDKPKPAKRQVVEAVPSESSKLKQFQQENEVFKQKIIELNSFLEKLKAELDLEKSKRADCEKKYNMILNSFEPEDKKKFFILAKNFIATFGKEFGMKTEENLVQLANGYPDVLVTSIEYEELMGLLEKNNASLVFRKMMKILIPDPIVWSERTGLAILNDYKNVISACLDFIKAKKSDFTLANVKMLLSQYCVDKRAALKKMLADTTISKLDEDKSVKNAENQAEIEHDSSESNKNEEQSDDDSILEFQKDLELHLSEDE